VNRVLNHCFRWDQRFVNELIRHLASRPALPRRIRQRARRPGLPVEFRDEPADLVDGFDLGQFGAAATRFRSDARRAGRVVTLCPDAAVSEVDPEDAALVRAAPAAAAAAL
jgi:hypothetical protein